jgi:hypothetical protein
MKIGWGFLDTGDHWKWVLEDECRDLGMVNIEQDGERVGKWGEYIDQEKSTHGGNSLIFAHECNRLLAKEPNQKQEHFFE